MLGQGCFSKVTRVQHRLDGQQYAVKRSIKPLLSDGDLRQWCQVRDPVAWMLYCFHITLAALAWFAALPALPAALLKEGCLLVRSAAPCSCNTGPILLPWNFLLTGSCLACANAQAPPLVKCCIHPPCTHSLMCTSDPASTASDQEVQALAAAGAHSGMVQFHGAWLESRAGGDHMFIQLQMCGLSLGSRLALQGQPLKEAELLDILAQVCWDGLGRRLCLKDE